MNERPVNEHGRLVDGIVTPEAVLLELETAGVGSRLVAALIDLAVVVGGLLVVLTLATAVWPYAESLLNTIAVVGLFLALLVVPVVEQMLMRGRTIGKAALGLRAVTVDGAPLRFRDAMLRTVGGLVDRLMPPGGMTGVLFVIGTPRGQTVGDLLAGTIVIRVPAAQARPAALWYPIPLGFEQYAATIDPSAMTPEQYTLVRSLLLRVRTLSPAARWDLVSSVAGRLASTLGHELPPQVHPETFLVCSLARYQRRTFPAYQPAEWGAAAAGLVPR